MRKNKVIYKLTVEDILTVAGNVLENKPTNEELRMVIDKVGKYLHWYDAILFSFYELNLKLANERRSE